LIERLDEAPSERLGAFVGSSAPENLTGAIAAFRPSHLVLVDAAELGLAPGEMQLIDPRAIAGTSFSTHMLPLRIILDYLAESVGCEVVVVGIQPEGTGFLAELSEPVRARVELVVETLLSIE
jgi:hydrogenase 3 maturation protease